MTYIYSFLFVGFICLIAQILFDNFNLTNGHITSIFVVVGAILGFFNLYDKFAYYVGSGASIPIMSFGNLLYKAAYYGYHTNGFLGIFSNMLTTTSAGITAAIIFSFICIIFSKPKN